MLADENALYVAVGEYRSQFGLLMHPYRISAVFSGKHQKAINVIITDLHEMAEYALRWENSGEKLTDPRVFFGVWKLDSENALILEKEEEEG